jgi:hypothetical protein
MSVTDRMETVLELALSRSTITSERFLNDQG